MTKVLTMMVPSLMSCQYSQSHVGYKQSRDLRKVILLFMERVETAVKQSISALGGAKGTMRRV